MEDARPTSLEQARAVWGNISNLLRVGLRSLAITLALSFGLGVILAIAAVLLLADHAGTAALLALIILAEAAAFGVFGGFQRAIASAMVHGIEHMQLGGRLVRAIFSSEFGLGGGPGNQLARAAERIPLAQAEQALSRAVNALLRADETARGLTGRLRHAIQTRLVEAIQSITLARFREEGAREGGIDLRKVQAELESRMDEYLADRFGQSVALATGLLLGGLVLLAVVEIAIVKALLG